jgi:hypothetical protein
MARGALSRALWLAAGLAGAAGCGGSGMGKQVRADVAARMQTIQAPVGSCYEAALKRNRKLAGTMTIEFVAAPGTGKFSQARVKQNDLPDPEIERCVLDEVQRLALSKPQKTAVAVEFPLRFAPADAPAPAASP